ncbi:MAG: histidine phosphatase family protein [Paenarthrobacter ureafaciens]|nr:histidine phosphatase family protein [Paenarthrobacter ureafaciens]
MATNRRVQRLIFARHGESETNHLNQFSTLPPGAPLSAAGHLQSIELSKQLNGCGIERIFASPLQRAADTAHVIGQALDLPVEYHDDLAEIRVPPLEGEPSSIAMPIMDRVWDQWTRQGQLTATPAPQSERGLDVLARLRSCLDHIYAGEFAGPVLVVGHGGMLQLTVPVLSVNLPDDHGQLNWMRNCQTVETTWDGAALTCVRWGEEPPGAEARSAAPLTPAHTVHGTDDRSASFRPGTGE